MAGWESPQAAPRRSRLIEGGERGGELRSYGLIEGEERRGRERGGRWGEEEEEEGLTGRSAISDEGYDGCDEGRIL